MKDVAVAVPAYNEEDVVTDALDALAETDEYATEQWLIDDGSEDETAALAKEYIEDHDLDIGLYENEENGGKVGAIHAALDDEISTDYVMVMDADSRIEDLGKLEDAVDYLENEDLAALGFRIEPDVQSDDLYSQTLEELQKRGYAFGRMLHRFTSWNFGRNTSQLRHMAGAGYISDREILNEALNMHSKEFDGEDMQTTSIIQLGLDEEVSYFPDLTVSTTVPDSMKELFEQRKGWNHGALHVYAEQADKYLSELTRIDRPLTQYTLYENLFLTGIAPILAAGVANEALQGNLEPLGTWYMTDTAVTAIGMEAGYQTDELEDRSYLKYLPVMAPYRAAAFFPGKLASFPEFLHSTGSDVYDSGREWFKEHSEPLKENINSFWDLLSGFKNSESEQKSIEASKDQQEEQEHHNKR